MVTGMEATGLVLALLPLLVNQLDNYVQGLETLKSFTAKRYLRELESYLTNLGAQQAIFLNTLGHALKDTLIVDDAIISTWIRNPKEDTWVGRAIHEELQSRLGTSFEPFMRTTRELSNLLEDLSKKLGLTNGGTLSLDSRSESFIKREVKKFRDIFSKSIYADLLSRIHTANAILKTLVDQSFHERPNHYTKRRLQGPLSHKSRRKSAMSLYSAVLNRDCWNCACKDQHSLWFALDPSLPDLLQMPHKASNHTFRMAFTSKKCTTSVGAGDCCHEVEAESIEISDSVSTCYTCSYRSGSRLNQSDTNVQAEATVSIISHLCSTIFTVHVDDKQRALIGCIADNRYQHHMYHVRSIANDLQSQSLEELIAISSTFPQPPLQGRYIFSRRDRLMLAVNLACSVLQFHGNWLRKYWRARDIMFLDEKFDPTKHPYVVCDIAGEPSMHNSQESSALIRSEVLFPLGLVLVELSLCRNLDSLRTQEDADPLEAVANLKTAARYLPVVEMESGLRYGQVVRRCLFGSDAVDTASQDETMQEKVFEYVIAPLFQNLRDFEELR